jgi:hypothetical protein
VARDRLIGHLLLRCVAQRPDAQLGRDRLARCAPLRVGRLPELASHPRVDDEDLEVRRHRNSLQLERATVDQKRVPLAAGRGCELIHDP